MLLMLPERMDKNVKITVSCLEMISDVRYLNAHTLGQNYSGQIITYEHNKDGISDDGHGRDNSPSWCHYGRP